MKAWSKPAVAAACLGYALIAAALFLASPWIRPVPSTGVFLAALSAAALWACIRLPVRIWLRGRALAGLLAQLGVDTLICGGIGGGAQAALAEANIRLIGGVQGNADEAVQAFLNGTLAFDPNVHCTHHDHGEGHSCGSHGCGGHCHE